MQNEQVSNIYSLTNEGIREVSCFKSFLSTWVSTAAEGFVCRAAGPDTSWCVSLSVSWEEVICPFASKALSPQ